MRPTAWKSAWKIFIKENLDYLTNLKSYNSETRLKKAKEIDQLYEKSKELSDEKVQVANQTYELVLNLFHKKYLKIQKY